MRGDAPRAIADYACIGDRRSAALVSRAGGIDWLCLPRFDSPSVFAAILDPERGGSFRIHPAGEFASSRRYIGASCVLETRFRTGSGELALTDFMPMAAGPAARARLQPDHALVRRVECTAGEVDVVVLFDPRPDYGRARPRLRRDALGAFVENGAELLVLRADAEPAWDDAGAAGLRGTFRLRAGDFRTFALAYTRREPIVLPDPALSAAQLAGTLAWWEGWARGFAYEGPFRDAVLRSALVLELLTYAPSGAIVAAPTTSLPEWPGGTRNWDYRYCWLRDASLTLRALLDLGFTVEGEAFLGWLLHATRMTWPELQVVYDVFGETRLAERELPHLAGFGGARPVRVGNEARSQLQLDTYGDVIDAAYRFVERGGELDHVTARMLRGLGDTVCRRWREPDEGIWEVRSGRRHHTVSKAMCWVALDRLLRLHRAGRITVDEDRYERERAAIRAAVEERGFDAALGSYVHALDGGRLDASLLLLPLYGYAPASAPRVRSTVARIRERLGVGPLLYRYRDVDDGLPAGEGAFGPCGFWAAHALALDGRVEEATACVEALLGYANDVGLFSEEIDPATGAALGNFPQGFTHVALIGAAVAVARARGEMPEAAEGAPHAPRAAA